MTIETGTASISIARSGALQIYIKKGIAEKIDLPIGKDLKVSWNSDKRELGITEL